MSFRAHPGGLDRPLEWPLPHIHEVGHVVQQRLGMVRPTTQFAGQAINDDPALERQATTWGEMAVRLGSGGE